MLMTASNHFQDSMKALELKVINYVTVRLQHHINLTSAGTAPLDLRFHDTEYYNVEKFASTLLQYLLHNNLFSDVRDRGVHGHRRRVAA